MRPAVALTAAVASLAIVELLDAAVRPYGLRLVPVYVPLLCVICWALPRWHAILLAIVAALIAILPDVMAATEPMAWPTVVNASVRIISYIVLALIIVSYRRTFDEADLRAMYDGLTGLLNRMSFNDAAAKQIAGARNTRHLLIVACADLDGFKKVNSRHGRSTGDAVLRSFARDTMNAIRGSDLAGRLGGDEFGFLLIAASENNAEAITRLLHQRLTTTLVKTGLPLSCSMGAVIAPAGAGFDEAFLLDAADRVMRRAKADGKNKLLTEVMTAAA